MAQNPKNLMQKCSEMVIQLQNFPNAFAQFNKIAKSSRKMFETLRTTENSNIRDVLSKFVGKIEKHVKVTTKKTTIMGKYGMRVRATLRNSEFAELKLLREQNHPDVRCPTEIEAAFARRSKKPIETSRIPMVKSAKSMKKK